VEHSAVPAVARLTNELTVARTGPGLGYLLFLPEGVKLWITGRKGDYWRARLSRSEEAWIPNAALAWLPPGTTPPEGTVVVVRTQGLTDRTRVKISLPERVPYKIEQWTEPSLLIVTLYGITSDTDWIRHDFDDPLIREIRWEQPEVGVYRLRIELRQKQQWGYHGHFDGNDLLLDIKKGPGMTPGRKPRLKGLRVCVDPGHGPDTGAVGPLGTIERDANLLLSVELKKQLEKKGAKVVMTRQTEQGPSLYDRPQVAVEANADILISVHNNALPDGVNPFRNHGSSAYYYHPQSYPLAVAIQRRFLEKLKLPNFGLFYDNLALCRPPQMPAVLVEPTFIMYPEEEQLLNSADFRKKIAEAIVKGIEDFVKSRRD